MNPAAREASTVCAGSSAHRGLDWAAIFAFELLVGAASGTDLLILAGLAVAALLGAAIKFSRRDLTRCAARRRPTVRPAQLPSRNGRTRTTSTQRPGLQPDSEHSERDRERPVEGAGCERRQAGDTRSRQRRTDQVPRFRVDMSDHPMRSR